MVVTTDAYTYIGIFAEILKKGFPEQHVLSSATISSYLLTQRVQIGHT